MKVVRFPKHLHESSVKDAGRAAVGIGFDVLDLTDCAPSARPSMKRIAPWFRDLPRGMGPAGGTRDAQRRNERRDPAVGYSAAPWARKASAMRSHFICTAHPRAVASWPGSRTRTSTP